MNIDGLDHYHVIRFESEAAQQGVLEKHGQAERNGSERGSIGLAWRTAERRLE